MISAWLWRVIMALAPADKAQWITAMRAEAAALPQDSDSVIWLRGATWAALRLRWSDTGYATEAAALAAAMIAVDWLSGAALPAILFIAITALVIISRCRHHVWPATVVAGGTLPLAHYLANLDRSLWPYYQFKPLDRSDWLILALLPLLAFAIAFASSRLIGCRIK